MLHTPTKQESREHREPGADLASERLADCLERVARGDEPAFRTLYDATRSYLLGVAFALLRHRERAEEVLQECYLTVWDGAARFDRRLSRPMTWLITIVRNRAIDAVRAQASRRHLNVATDDDVLDTVVDAAPRPDQQMQHAMERRALEAALQRLGTCERQALAMVLYRGMTPSAIATHTRVPPGTAKAWVRRGLAHLKLHLEATAA